MQLLNALQITKCPIATWGWAVVSIMESRGVKVKAKQLCSLASLGEACVNLFDNALTHIDAYGNIRIEFRSDSLSGLLDELYEAPTPEMLTRKVILDYANDPEFLLECMDINCLMFNCGILTQTAASPKFKHMRKPLETLYNRLITGEPYTAYLLKAESKLDYLTKFFK